MWNAPTGAKGAPAKAPARKAAGARRRRARSESPARAPRRARPELSTVVTPKVLTGEPLIHSTGEAREAQLGGGDLRGWLAAEKTKAMMAKLSEGTAEGYKGGWRAWVLYRQAAGKTPFLYARHYAERRQDEDDLLDYVIHLARVMGRQDGTIRQKLFAIRYAHLVEGLPDPLLHRTRLWAALGGIHRWQGAARRKHPVTPRMLKWLRVHLGVAVHLGGRGEEHARGDALREAEHVERALGARLDRLDRVVLVVRRARGAREVVDLVDLEHDRFYHITDD